MPRSAAEAAEVGQADGEVGFDDGLGVEALLVEPRPAVEPDAHDLEQVAGLLGVVQRPEVVAVVGQPVPVESGHQRLHRVGGGQRAVVAAGLGLGHGLVGQAQRSPSPRSQWAVAVQDTSRAASAASGLRGLPVALAVDGEGIARSPRRWWMRPMRHARPGSGGPSPAAARS